MNQWPIIDATLVNTCSTCAGDWDEGLEIAEQAAKAQRRSDWQHAWAQAAAELRQLADTFPPEIAEWLNAMSDDWEERAKEED